MYVVAYEQAFRGKRDTCCRLELTKRKIKANANAAQGQNSLKD